MDSHLSIVALALCLFASALPHQHAVVGSTTSVGSLVVTGKMRAARATHSATLLSDGKVLIARGMENDGMIFDSADLYDDATGRFTPTGKMSEARAGFSAVLLKNGRVLVVGGWGPDSILSSCEIYDPATGRFTRTGSLHTRRGRASLTLLPDGRVLATAARNPTA
jgi:hypothetical protein